MKIGATCIWIDYAKKLAVEIEWHEVSPNVCSEERIRRRAARGVRCDVYVTSVGRVSPPSTSGYSWWSVDETAEFDHQFGKNLALTRALQQLPLGRDDRRVVWGYAHGRDLPQPVTDGLRRWARSVADTMPAKPVATGAPATARGKDLPVGARFDYAGSTYEVVRGYCQICAFHGVSSCGAAPVCSGAERSDGQLVCFRLVNDEPTPYDRLASRLNKILTGSDTLPTDPDVDRLLNQVRQHKLAIDTHDYAGVAKRMVDVFFDRLHAHGRSAVDAMRDAVKAGILEAPNYQAPESPAAEKDPPDVCEAAAPVAAPATPEVKVGDVIVVDGKNYIVGEGDCSSCGASSGLICSRLPRCAGSIPGRSNNRVFRELSGQELARTALAEGARFVLGGALYRVVRARSHVDCYGCDFRTSELCASAPPCTAQASADGISKEFVRVADAEEGTP